MREFGQVFNLDIGHTFPDRVELRLLPFTDLSKPAGWVLAHLELWDELGRLVDAGALGNQTSPLYVAQRQPSS